jgi:hypothetical protein
MNNSNTKAQLRGSTPIKSSFLTMNETKEVLELFDEDSNGQVEERELVNWIVSGIKRSDDARAEFALTSTIAAKLDFFLQNIILYIKQWHNHPDDDANHKTRTKHRESRINRELVVRRKDRNASDYSVSRGSDRSSVGKHLTYRSDDSKNDESSDDDNYGPHIDSWDETFQHLEHTYRNENPTAEDLKSELSALTTTFQKRMKEMERQMHVMHVMQSSIQKQQYGITMGNTNAPESIPLSTKKANERIHFLESRLEMLCNRLGIDENEVERREGRDTTVPYIQMTSNKKSSSSQERTMKQQPHHYRHHLHTHTHQQETNIEKRKSKQRHDDNDGDVDDGDDHLLVYDSENDDHDIIMIESSDDDDDHLIKPEDDVSEDDLDHDYVLEW